MPVTAGTSLPTTKPRLLDGKPKGWDYYRLTPGRCFAHKNLPRSIPSHFQNRYGTLRQPWQEPCYLRKNLAQRFALAGSLLYSKYDPAKFIGVPLKKPRDGNRHVLGTRRLSIANSLPQEIASPETVSRSRITFNQESRRLGTIPAAARPSDRPKGRSALSSFVIAGIPPPTRNGSRLRCRRTTQVRSKLPLRVSLTSNQATLPESSASITHATKHGHREPPRPLDSFQH